MSADTDTRYQDWCALGPFESMIDTATLNYALGWMLNEQHVISLALLVPYSYYDFGKSPKPSSKRLF